MSLAQRCIFQLGNTVPEAYVVLVTLVLGKTSVEVHRKQSLSFRNHQTDLRRMVHQ